MDDKEIMGAFEREYTRLCSCGLYKEAAGIQMAEPFIESRNREVDYLKNQLEWFKEQIERMKCCGNCKNGPHPWGAGKEITCEKCSRFIVCAEKDNWEMKS